MHDPKNNKMISKSDKNISKEGDVSKKHYTEQTLV